MADHGQHKEAEGDVSSVDADDDVVVFGDGEEDHDMRSFKVTLRMRSAASSSSLLGGYGRRLSSAEAASGLIVRDLRLRVDQTKASVRCSKG